MINIEKKLPFKQRMDVCYGRMSPDIKKWIWIVDPDTVNEYGWQVFDHLMVYVEHCDIKFNQTNHSIAEHFMWLSFKKAVAVRDSVRHANEYDFLDSWLYEATGSAFCHDLFVGLSTTDTIKDYYKYKFAVIDTQPSKYDEAIDALNRYFIYYFFKSEFSKILYQGYSQEFYKAPSRRNSRTTRISYNDIGKTIASIDEDDREKLYYISKNQSRKESDVYLVSGYIWDACCHGFINVKLVGD